MKNFRLSILGLFCILRSFSQQSMTSPGPARTESTFSAAGPLSRNFSSVDNFALSLKKKYNDIDDLAFDLTKDYTDEADKVRSIYRWITENISFDCREMRRGCPAARAISKRNEDLDDYRWNLARHVLLSKKGVCEGYATLFYQLCSSAGIKSCFVEGLADGNTKWIRFCRRFHCYYPDHCWNKVKVNGDWYFLDATWSSGTCNGRITHFYKEFNEKYFLVALNNLYETHVENN